jgi:hypothetical protein
MKKGDLFTATTSGWFNIGDVIEYTGESDGALHEFKLLNEDSYFYLRTGEFEPYRSPYEKELFHAFQERGEMIEKLTKMVKEAKQWIDDIDYALHCETRSEELTKEFE